jgi:hypothetical protein
MGRPLDPKSKTAQIVILPVNEEEENLFREFKRVLAKDNQTVREFFLPSIQAKAALDNPQLHFQTDSEELVLNKIVPEENWPEDKPTKCYVCNGTGKLSRGQECQECLGKGEFYIVKGG